MLARLHSTTLVGIDAIPCEIEVNVASRGFGAPVIVGLPDAAVKESLDRIRTAIINCGFQTPRMRTVINLAPADVRKEGPAMDLPIALGMLFAADGECPERAADYMIAGELALDGRVRSIRGALSMAMLARQEGYRGVIVPRENAEEAAVVEDIEVIAVAALVEAVGFLTEQLPIESTTIDLERVFSHAAKYDLDFADVKGQEFCKRAMTIAAAGGHNILMVCPSASSKLSPFTPTSYRRIRQFRASDRGRSRPGAGCHTFGLRPASSREMMWSSPGVAHAVGIDSRRSKGRR